MKFLNLISRGGDLPLNNIIYNVNSNIIVIAKKEAIQGYTSGGITAVIIGELRKGEELCPDGLIFSGISA